MVIQIPSANLTLSPTFQVLPPFLIANTNEALFNPSYSYPVDCMIEIMKREKYDPSVTWLGKHFDILTGWTLDEEGLPNLSLIERIKNAVSIWFRPSRANLEQIRDKNLKKTETPSLIDRVKSTINFWLRTPFFESAKEDNNEIIECLSERVDKLSEEINDLENRAEQLGSALSFINSNVKEFYNKHTENLDPLLASHESFILDIMEFKSSVLTKYETQRLLEFFLLDQSEYTKLKNDDLSSLETKIKWKLGLYSFRNAEKVIQFLDDVEPVINDFLLHFHNKIDELILKEVRFINMLIFDKDCGHKTDERLSRLQYLHSLSYREQHHYVSKLTWKEKKELMDHLAEQKQAIDDRVEIALKS